MESSYYKNEDSVKEYINLAKDASGLNLIDKLKKHLDKGAKLLELGSGPGTDYSILNSYYEATGSDNSNEFLKHLRLKIPEGKFINVDASTMLTDEKYKGIYSNKVLHHLTDKELHQSISKQTEILLPNGIICHSFWKGTGLETFKGMFVNYHTIEELEKYFAEQFDILLLENYEEFEKNDSILLIARLK